MLLVVIILGIIEGLTEFIPVSSTGHLVIGASLLKFDPVWREPFLVVIQLGAIFAVVVDRRREILAMMRQHQIVRFGLLLFVAFLPAAVVGLLVHHAISGLLQRPVYVSAAWIIGGIAILLLDRPRANPAVTDIQKVTFTKAGLIGLAQCLSLWPGMSRSASTIIGGLTVGLDRSTATLFSFYLAIPTMFAASGYELVRFRHELSGAGVEFAVGMAVSFLVAWATVRWLLAFVRTHSFQGFAFYRIVVGALLLLLPAAWWR
jgi:undecaprenyl-diphosphatase